MTGDDSQPAPIEQPEELTPDIRAAEYVLGTLGSAEREEAQAMLSLDPVFASLVHDWERRLGELHALADNIEPPPAVWGHQGKASRDRAVGADSTAGNTAASTAPTAAIAPVPCDRAQQTGGALAHGCGCG